MLQVWGGVMWGLPGCGTGATSQCPRSGATSARVARLLSASCCALALWTGRRRSLSTASAWAFTAEGECALLCLRASPAKMLARPLTIL